MKSITGKMPKIDYWQRFFDFFALRQECPICGEKLSRDINAAFSNTNGVSYYVSDPMDKENYRDFIFQKADEKKHHWITDNRLAITPAALHLIEKSPPAYHFLELKRSTLSAFHGASDHYFRHSMMLGDQKSHKETWKFDGLHITIDKDNIAEITNRLRLPTKESYLLKFNETVNLKILIEKLVLLSQ